MSDAWTITYTPWTRGPALSCWHFKTGGFVDSSPTVVDGVVYIGSWDQALCPQRSYRREIVELQDC